MRKPYHLFALMAFAFTAAVTSVSAQDDSKTRERFVISAKAGGINALTGRAGVKAPGSSQWEQLTIKDNLEAGDVVKTAADGRVEMLLNPGSYLRVAENSEFELANNSLDNLEVRLIRGTAIVEATGGDDTELLINLTTPHTKMTIVRRGLYRVKVVPGDVTELIVRKGQVLLADSHTKVKDIRKLIFSGPTFSMAKLDKAYKEMDDFDRWSKERAEIVIRANRILSSPELRAALESFRHAFLNGTLPSAHGFWWYNARAGCYTFIPFGSSGLMSWGSPYDIGSYRHTLYGLHTLRPDLDSNRGYTNTPRRDDGDGTLRNPSSSGKTKPED